MGVAHAGAASRPRRGGSAGAASRPKKNRNRNSQNRNHRNNTRGNGSGQNNSGTNGTSSSLTSSDIYEKLQSMIPETPQTNEFMQGSSDYYKKVMDPNYKTWSSDEVQRMYDSQNENLTNDIINPEDKKLAAKLAISGQTGSGFAGKDWEDKSYYNKRLRSDMWNKINDQNLQLTQQERSQAFNSSTALSNMVTDSQRYPAQAWMELAKLIGEDEARKYEQKQTKEQQKSKKKKEDNEDIMKVIMTILSFL
jgi:hypothetical protein